MDQNKKHRFVSNANIIKGIIFTIIFCFLFTIINAVFMHKHLEEPLNFTVKIHGLENETEDQFDTMFFGGSSVYFSMNPTVIYKDTGIKSYVYASSGQMIWLTYYYIVEALKSQNPDVVVVGLNSIIRNDEEYMKSSRNHTALDYMPFSANKIQMIDSATPEDDRINYYIPFLEYHSRWKELTQEDFNFDFLEETDPIKGYRFASRVKPIELDTNVLNVEERAPLPDKYEFYLREIIKLSQEKDFELVFFIPPVVMTEPKRMRCNTIKEIAEENNIPYIDYNEQYEILELDPELDFFDTDHVNYSGSEKISESMAMYLQENYGLGGRMDPQEKEQWATSYDYYLSMIQQAEEEAAQLQESAEDGD